MKRANFLILVLLMILPVLSCKDLEGLNDNPNEIDPDEVNPSLVIATVLTNAAQVVVDEGFQDLAGVMQHTQKCAWYTAHNDYDWSGEDWTDFYAVALNCKYMGERGEAMDYPFYQGVAKVMSAYIYGWITDLWGDAPYTEALQGDEDNFTPVYDEQETIYLGIIDDLKEGIEFLLEYEESSSSSTTISEDVIYSGSSMQWRQFASSLILRYYMRISSKLPDEAQEGIEALIADPTTYPLILESADDANMTYIGSSSSDSWYSNTEFDSDGTIYRRLKACATLVDALEALDDPRIAVWLKKVEIPLVVSDSLPDGTDEIVDSVRYLSLDEVENVDYDTDKNYVGLPPSLSDPSGYNMNPTPGQNCYNPHVSYINTMYKSAAGDLLLARMCSAAEVNFVLAEAALKGWSVGGTAEDFYNEAIYQSFVAWGVSADYDTYIAGEAAYNDSESDEEQLERIITQKWIASWTAAGEAWFDYRRTGYPAIEAGSSADRSVPPVRYIYMEDELTLNATNAEEALSRLETTSYTQSDGTNSAWSKMWVLQDTNEPW